MGFPSVLCPSLTQHIHNSHQGIYLGCVGLHLLQPPQQVLHQYFGSLAVPFAGDVGELTPPITVLFPLAHSMAFLLDVQEYLTQLVTVFVERVFVAMQV
jgi:hypothetical protein